MESEASRPGEDALIARYFAPLAGPGGLGLKDDAALIAPAPGHDLVLTADTLVAGVHFFPDDPPASIGRKALAVNVSDLAAKGAQPLGYLLSLALPDDWTEAWLAGFSEGLAEAAQRFGCPLLGGDTVRMPEGLVLGITVLGQVPGGSMVRRTTARPGDRLLVSGTIGDSSLGLALRKERDDVLAGALSLIHRAFLTDRYLHPQPRLALSQALRRHASAAMDVSDGLVGDLAKMMRAGGTGAAVDLAAIPLSEAARAMIAGDPALFERAITGGDDYEILCAVPPGAVAAFGREAREARIPTAEIGIVDGEGGCTFRDADGAVQSFDCASYSHFR